MLYYMCLHMWTQVFKTLSCTTMLFIPAAHSFNCTAPHKSDTVFNKLNMQLCHLHSHSSAKKTFQLDMSHTVSHFSKEIWMHMDIQFPSPLLSSPTKDISSEKIHSKIFNCITYWNLNKLCHDILHTHTKRELYFRSNKLDYLTDRTFITFSKDLSLPRFFLLSNIVRLIELTRDRCGIELTFAKRRCEVSWKIKVWSHKTH